MGGKYLSSAIFMLYFLYDISFLYSFVLLSIYSYYKILAMALCYIIHGACMLSHGQLCNNMDYSPPGSSIQGIFQARIFQWVALSYSMSNASFSLSYTQQFVPPTPFPLLPLPLSSLVTPTLSSIFVNLLQFCYILTNLLYF